MAVSDSYLVFVLEQLESVPRIATRRMFGGVGLYRLVVKWGWFEGTDPDLSRRRLTRLKWGITAFFLVLGLLTLAAYMKIGYEHRHRAGEVYVPTWVRPAGPAGAPR